MTYIKLLKIYIIVSMVLVTTVKVNKAVPSALLKNGVKRSVSNAQKNGEENKRSPRAPLFSYIIIP